MYASRFWWMLRWMSHDNVAVLDGGFAKWLAEKRQTASGTESRPHRTFPGRRGSDMVVSARRRRGAGRTIRLATAGRAGTRTVQRRERDDRQEGRTHPRRGESLLQVERGRAQRDAKRRRPCGPVSSARSAARRRIMSSAIAGPGSRRVRTCWPWSMRGCRERSSIPVPGASGPAIRHVRRNRRHREWRRANAGPRTGLVHLRRCSAAERRPRCSSRRSSSRIV